MKDLSTTTKTLLLLSVVVALSSCSPLPPKPEVSTFRQANESLKEEHPERPELNADLDCDQHPDGDDNEDNDICHIKWGKWVAFTDLISKMRDSLEKKIDKNNSLVDALTECEYQNALADREIQALKNESTTKDIISTTRSVALLAICAGGLFYGN